MSSAAALFDEMVANIPYLGFLGIRFDVAGHELTGVLPFREGLIGNPLLPALHGGVISAFLEVTAISGLLWPVVRRAAESGLTAETILRQHLPRTIDLTTDFLRPGLSKDSFARARINRSGRRYASVHVEAWQDDPNRPIAQATGHFLMPLPERATTDVT